MKKLAAKPSYVSLRTIADQIMKMLHVPTLGATYESIRID